SSVPLERQKLSLELLHGIAERSFDFADKSEARTFFTKLTSDLKNFNYAADGTPDYERYLESARGVAP
ncbi:MAG: V-type ATP synthase subunit A, partial [Pseudomonadota bacterium]